MLERCQVEPSPLSHRDQNMRRILITLFSAILILMLAVTTWASLDRNIFNVGWPLLSDPWFQATLCDAYLGFLTFFVWVAYKEQRNASRVIWFVLVMTLGNIAMSLYMLIQLAKLKRTESWSNLLLRDSPRTEQTGVSGE